jgi:phosphate-selective porin OprO/OprP
LPSSLVANRDIGVQAQGDLAGAKLSYSGGVFNGVPDGTSSTTDVDANAGKDVAGRVVIQPFRAALGQSAGALNGLGFQIGGSSGKETGTLPAFKTSVGQTFFSYTGATANGTRHRLAPAFFYYARAFGVFGEFIQSTQAVVNTKSAVTQNIRNRAWDISAEYNLTGEAASTSVPKPKRAFDPPTGKWGALTLVARYAELRVDPAAFEAGDVTAGSSRRAQQYTVGVNWMPVNYVKYYLNYERTVFDGNAHGPRPAEDVVFLRVQTAF